MTDIKTVQRESSHKELHWYIESIIIKELPQLIETLEICLNLLLYNTPQHPDPAQQIQRGPSIKLPLTSNKLEILKGILIRDGAYVTGLSISLHQSNFNKVLRRITLSKPLLLKQIIITKKYINESIVLLKKFIEYSSECDNRDHTALIALFNDLLSKISIGKQNLQIPLDPDLVFPLNVTPIHLFEPELPPNITVDVYLSQAEICIDLKKLHVINELPWSQIDENGKSYVDKIRDEMKLPSYQSMTPGNATAAATPTLKSEPLKLSDLDTKLNNINQSNFFNNMLSSLNIKPKLETTDYITKCVTYNKMVVMVNTKINVSSPDPVLTSVFTKLDSIEHLLASFLENLDNIVS